MPQYVLEEYPVCERCGVHYIAVFVEQSGLNIPGIILSSLLGSFEMQKARILVRCMTRNVSSISLLPFDSVTHNIPGRRGNHLPMIFIIFQ